jgi:general stress protein 26
MGWLPRPVEELLEVALVSEVTVVGPADRPITHPMIPLYKDGKVYLHSSTLYSRKLEHLKRDPRLSVSLSDPIAMDGASGRVTIQGTARIIEDDPHSDWEHLILDLWRMKEPSVDPFLKARVALPLFFERAVVEVTPERCLYWPDGNTTRPPKVTAAPLQGAA